MKNSFAQLRRQYFGWGKVYAHKISEGKYPKRYTECLERALYLTSSLTDKNVKDKLIDAFMLGCTQTFDKEIRKK